MFALFVCVAVFFFKQKTAYEMRSSDWSSDVCSSDLQYHAFASFLTYGLGMLRSDVALLDASQLGAAEALAQLDEGDVVVVASCAPYTRSIAEIAEAAAACGLAVVAVTDTRASPLVDRQSTRLNSRH